MVDYVNDTKGNTRLPGIMTLGYISAFSETLAYTVIVSKAVPTLTAALVSETEDHIRAATAWALGQIGRHSPDHAAAVAEANALPKMLALYTTDEGSEDLKTKAKRALKSIIQKCVTLSALEPLIDSPPNIQRYPSVLLSYAFMPCNDTLLFLHQSKICGTPICKGAAF